MLYLVYKACTKATSLNEKTPADRETPDPRLPTLRDHPELLETPDPRLPVGPSVNHIGQDNVPGRRGAAVVDGDRQLPPADMMAICV
ncbi:unnamed protein product [Boreogadus saida]